MHYEDKGQGQPLVLLHGWPLSAAMWRPQVAALAQVCRLLLPDLRGFGGSPGFEGAPSTQQMADDVHALLDRIPIREPIVLGGLSMGGYVALAFARKHAGRLRGLILADTRAEADSAEGKANRDKMIAFAEQHTAGEVMDQLAPKLFAPETLKHRPQIVAELRQVGAVQSRAAIIDGARALRDRPDQVAFLGAIAVPTLVLVGSEDALTPPTMSQTLAAGINNARLVMIPGAGHMSNMEQPDLFNDAVRGFLQTLPAKGLQ
jgi:3-oxoadipate enol-lactonase